MAAGVFTFCTILVPEIGREEKAANPNAGPFWPFLLNTWVLSIPIFIALYESLKILAHVDQNTTFTKLTIRSVQKIKMCAVIFGSMIIASGMTILIIGQKMDPSEDFAPIVTITFIFTFMASVVATFANVIEKVLKEALDMKSENELTI